MAFDLASFAKPISRAEAIRQGHLVDCTQAAAWAGFRTPAAVSADVWEECIGHHSIGTREDHRAAGLRLSSFWFDAARALAKYKRSGVVLPSVGFSARSVDGKRRVALLMTAGFDQAGQVHITVTLGD